MTDSSLRKAKLLQCSGGAVTVRREWMEICRRAGSVAHVTGGQTIPATIVSKIASKVTGLIEFAASSLRAPQYALAA